jgi:hypothetical protein
MFEGERLRSATAIAIYKQSPTVGAIRSKTTGPSPCSASLSEPLRVSVSGRLAGRRDALFLPRGKLLLSFRGSIATVEPTATACEGCYRPCRAAALGVQQRNERPVAGTEVGQRQRAAACLGRPRCDRIAATVRTDSKNWPVPSGPCPPNHPNSFCVPCSMKRPPIVARAKTRPMSIGLDSPWRSRPINQNAVRQ